MLLRYLGLQYAPPLRKLALKNLSIKKSKYKNLTIRPALIMLSKKCCPFLPIKDRPTRFRTTVLDYPLLTLEKSKSVVFRIHGGRLTCGSRHVFESFVTAPRACNPFTRTHTAAHSPLTAAGQYADHEFHETRKRGTFPTGV